MNIEQIQARIQNYPIPLLQQYANGSNPEVPGWLALSVLQQKEAMGRQVANAQGAAQGQMPTVKQQLEQKLGTMQQQASMQPQGLAQAQVPPPQGPVQGEPPAGGLTSGNAGSSMNFARGGIIGYNGEKDSHVKYETPYDRSNRENQEEGTAGLEPFLRYIRAPLDAAADVARLPVSLVEHMAYNGKGESPSWTPAMDDRARYLEGLKNSPQAVQARAENTPSAAPVIGNTQTAPTGNVMGSRRTPDQVAANPNPVGPQGLAGAQVRPAAAPVAPAAPAANSTEAMLRSALANRPSAPTVEGAAGIVQGMQKQFGVDQPAGAEERAMIAKMNQAYAQSKEGEGLRNLQSVLSAFGRGHGAAGLENVRLHDAGAAADMAHQKAIYDLTHGINAANRKEQVEAAQKGMGMYGEQEKTRGEFDRSSLTALASMYHTDKSAAAQVQSAKIMAAARESGMDSKEIQMAEAAYARDPEALAIKKSMESPLIANNPAKMQQAVDKLVAIQRSKYAAFGIKIPGTPSAPNTGGKVLDWNSIGK